MNIQKGFTLIELLVVVAIIGILATITIASLGTARNRANDAAIAASLSSYRTEVELELNGEYTNICSSNSYLEIESYIESKGGIISSCEGSSTEYRIIAGLVSFSSLNSSYVKSAYAQECGEEEVCESTPERKGFCINSNNKAVNVVISDVQSLPSPYCEASELASSGPYSYSCAADQCTNGSGQIVPNSECSAAGLDTNPCGI